MFDRYIGIDYSGAMVPNVSLPGLRVYAAEVGSSPSEVPPPPSPRRYWSRKEIAYWLEARLAEGQRSLIGIDHGFSFPVQYFAQHGLPFDWPRFLDDFVEHWPTDRDHTYVDFVREGMDGNAAARWGDARWRRLTERRAKGAKSVFHFDVIGSVAKSTHAGLPWLRYLRQRAAGRVHFWPFDGWEVPPDRSVIAEMYPSLWSKTYPREDRNPHQHDAWTLVRWMLGAAADGSLEGHFYPQLDEIERKTAVIEGWILGVR